MKSFLLHVDDVLSSFCYSSKQESILEYFCCLLLGWRDTLMKQHYEMFYSSGVSPSVQCGILPV